MEISYHLYPKQVSVFSTRRFSLQKSSKLNMISCRANTLETQRDSKNHYEVLSLESDKVGFDEIKKAYRSMARQYHPDVVPASRKEESTKRFVELQQAYETLSDPISRQKYDSELSFSYLAGYGVKGIRTTEANYSKDTWEDQLRGLQSRSYGRMRKKRC